MTYKSRKISCFEVLNGLFCELEAPYWPPSRSSGSGSGSVKNEYGSETLFSLLHWPWSWGYRDVGEGGRKE
jgi:hypothetical protein